MARKKNQIANYVISNMDKIVAHVIGLSDSELGIWTRKAITDLCNGCKDPNTDCLVREIYEKSQHLMLKKQNENSRYYRNRLARQGKTLAESATRTSEADKALADGDIREDSLNVTDGRDAAQLESGTSAKTFVTTTDVSTPCTISADGPRQAEARQSRGTGSDSLRGTKQPESHSGKDSVLLPAEPKKPYGSCGHVMLTDSEGRHLREVYGDDLAIAIDILDGYLENNPKALKKYKNHAAVLRKGNWVYNKILEMKNNELRLNNAKKQGDRRSFAQKDRDDRSEWLSHSMFELPEAANG